MEGEGEEEEEVEGDGGEGGTGLKNRVNSELANHSFF